MWCFNIRFLIYNYINLVDNKNLSENNIISRKIKKIYIESLASHCRSNSQIDNLK